MGEKIKYSKNNITETINNVCFPCFLLSYFIKCSNKIISETQKIKLKKISLKRKLLCQLFFSIKFEKISIDRYTIFKTIEIKINIQAKRLALLSNFK